MLISYGDRLDGICFASREDNLSLNGAKKCETKMRAGSSQFIMLRRTTMVEGTHQIEHFFRPAAGLEVDKEDIRRYYDFVDRKIADLLLMGQRVAKANDRIRIEPRDLPIN